MTKRTLSLCSLLLSLVLLSLLLRPGKAHAQGFIIPELGSRVNGMGAAVGRPDELSAIYHNPAALALLPGTQVGVSFMGVWLNTDIRLRPWDLCSPPSPPCGSSDKLITDPVDAQGYYPRQRPTVFAPVPFVGVSTKLWSEKVTGAFGVYVPNAAGASFGAATPSRYHIIDAYLISAFFTLAAAYRPWHWLAVGAGASVVYVRIHRQSLLYPVFNNVDVSGLLGKNTELTVDGSDVQPAFSLGIQAWPHRTVSLGFMMLSGQDITLEGPLRLKLDPSVTAIPADPRLTENRQRTEVRAPWIFGFGAHWDITPWLEVGAEFRWYTNSVNQQLITVVEQISEAEKAKGVEEKVLPTLLPPVAPNRPNDRGLVTPKHLHDSYHTGGGFKFHPPLRRVDLEFLIGMHFDNSASPNNTIEVSAPSFNLFSLHQGARWRINERFRVALFYSHYWYLERTTTDSITSPPTNFTGSAESNGFIVVLEGRVARGIGVR